jgi:hypothetical protein
VGITPALRIPVPSDWTTVPEDVYRQRLPQNDYPLVALASPDASQLLSIRMVRLPARGTPLTSLKLQDMLTESAKQKYPGAVLTDSRTSRTDQRPWAQVIFQNTDSVANRQVVAFVGVVNDELVIVTWHLHRDAIAAAKANWEADIATLTAFLDRGAARP